MRIVITLCLALTLSVTAHAQDALEEIVVTAQRAVGGYYEMPAVTITKQADFLVQNIRLTNDSRAPDQRRKEILATIRNLLDRAEAMKGMALSYGSGFLEPINLDDTALELLEDRQRVDTSYIDIYAKIAFDSRRHPKRQIEDLREFVDGTRVDGRTEILPLGDIGLSIVGPEQYRHEIIAKIGAENARILESMNSSCDVTVGGLEGRVMWRRSSLSELTLYIPYGLELRNCAR